MKICILGVRYKPGSGGMYAYQKNVKDGLEARGHIVHIIAPEVGEEHRNDPTVHEAGVFGFYPLREFIRKTVFAFTSFNLLRSLHKDIKFDLVYTMGAFGLNSLFITKILKIPTVNHAPFPSRHRLKAERGFKKFLYLFPLSLLEYPALRYSDKIIILSEAFRDVIRKLCPKIKNENIVVVPNGVDIPSKQVNCVEARNKYNVGVNTFLYLYVGWVTEKKGVINLLDAFKMINYDNKKLILIGDVDKRINVRDQENVLFTGYISDEDRNKLFECSDVFVFPSHSEGQPITVLEAMSYSLPVITSDKDGMVDQVEDGRTGFLVEPNRTGSLAETMEYISSLPQQELKKMGELGKAKAIKDFSWDSVIERLLKVFKEVVAQ